MSDTLRSAETGRKLRHRSVGLRPPWTSEISVRKSCTGCGKCVDACPQGILLSAYAGTPAVDFSRGECTFCKACADVCGEDVFDDTGTPPWRHVAAIGSGCLQAAGIGCQLCTDSCPQAALRLDLSRRPFGRIAVSTEACNGCGACVASCPVSAISMEIPEQEAEYG